MDNWEIEFEGGFTMLVQAEGRDDAMKEARRQLSSSQNFDVRRASMGRIVRCYKLN